MSEIQKDLNYVFHNPGYVKVRQRVPEQSDIIKTDTNIWQIYGLKNKLHSVLVK